MSAKHHSARFYFAVDKSGIDHHVGSRVGMSPYKSKETQDQSVSSPESYSNPRFTDGNLFVAAHTG